MRKWIKLIFILSIILLTSGCDGVYNLEIYNEEYKEIITVIEDDSSIWDEPNKNGITYRQLLDDEYNRDNFHYDKRRISTGDKLGLEYKINFGFDGYSTSSVVNRCYDYFRVIEEDDYILIATSNKNKCYDQYEWLNSITVNVKTNHKVIDNNADRVNGYIYSWDLNRDEASNKSIMIKLAKDEYIYNYENAVFKDIAIYVGFAIGSILLIALIVIIYIAYNKRVNKI